MERKKTTLYIDPELWRKAKVKATIQDKTVTDFLNELIERETADLSSVVKESKK